MTKTRSSLAIGRMFGGISKKYYNAYHENLPGTEPVEQYQLRGDLYELFHYLNHTLLFGVRFCTRTEEINSSTVTGIICRQGGDDYEQAIETVT